MSQSATQRVTFGTSSVLSMESTDSIRSGEISGTTPERFY